tara:strand:- start:137 stop:1879 length:1743 start_codon:yes stop_codon:yes gene_type:complete
MLEELVLYLHVKIFKIIFFIYYNIMSGKYFFTSNGQTIDINDVVDSTGSDAGIQASYPGMLGNIQGHQTLNASGVSTNVSGSSISNIPTYATYFGYNDDEIDEAPQYFKDNKNIFAHNGPGGNRTIVSTLTLTYSTTVAIPDWANAIKIYFRSKGGSQGPSGANVSKQEENHDRAGDHRNERKRGHNKDHRHTRIHTRVKKNYDSQDGGVGGAGGDRVISWFFKYVRFNSGTNNSIVCAISNTDTHSSEVTVKENGTQIAKYTFSNGNNGQQGGDAEGGVNKNTTANLDNYNRNRTYDRGDRRHREHHHHNTTVVTGSTEGAPGGPGTSGEFTANQEASSGYRLHYNDAGTEQVEVRIYYFRFNTNLINSNPFTWTSYSNYGGSGWYTKNNLNTRTVTTNSGYAAQDLYWARSGTLGTLEYNTDVSPATSTVQQLPSSFPSGHAFFFETPTNITLKRFDIYVSNNADNVPYFPAKLRVYGTSYLVNNILTGGPGVGAIEIFCGKPTVISEIPDKNHYSAGGLNICNNNVAYQYYFFLIEEIDGPITSSDTYYGLKINYIHPFIQESNVIFPNQNYANGSY